jgi:hypothetical protein
VTATLNYALTEQASPAVTGWLDRMVRRFMDAAATAAPKNFVSELTPDEAIAIAIIGGASWEIKDGKMITEPCGLYKREGKWTVCLYAPNVRDQGSAPCTNYAEERK